MPETYAMTGGDGPQSYAQNSSYQRGVVEAAKEIIKEEIGKNLDIKQLSPTSVDPFCIADFGCSTGPNTFLAVRIIIEALEEKFKTEQASEVPEFQVFFNDQECNDFNTLFASLPPERHFFTAAVPGSFHGVLFPKASLHFAYSSCTLNWLSELPKAIADKTTPAWNGGKIHYRGAKKEVFDAYAAQFAKDLESFLNARARELVNGGLMALLIPAVPNDVRESHTTTSSEIDMELLGYCLVGMAKKGLIDEAKVYLFNLPLYYTYPNELKALLDRNQDFTVERMEMIKNPGKHDFVSSPGQRALFSRAVFEGLLEKQFGSEIMDELFLMYANKVAESTFLIEPDCERQVMIFAFRKRKMRI